jgi:hypothetical protein
MPEFREEIRLDSQMRGLPNIFSCDQIGNSLRVRDQVNTENAAPFSSDSALRIEAIIQRCGDKHDQNGWRVFARPPDLS